MIFQSQSLLQAFAACLSPLLRYGIILDAHTGNKLGSVYGLQCVIGSHKENLSKNFFYLSFPVFCLQENDHSQKMFFQDQLDIHRGLSTATVSSVASKLGVSLRILSTLFRQYLSQSPKQYILTHKLETESYLLRNDIKLWNKLPLSWVFPALIILLKSLSSALAAPHAS